VSDNTPTLRAFGNFRFAFLSLIFSRCLSAPSSLLEWLHDDKTPSAHAERKYLRLHHMRDPVVPVPLEAAAPLVLAAPPLVEILDPVARVEAALPQAPVTSESPRLLALTSFHCMSCGEVRSQWHSITGVLDFLCHGAGYPARITCSQLVGPPTRHMRACR
jgi:hypothetical protein